MIIQHKIWILWTWHVRALACNFRPKSNFYVLPLCTSYPRPPPSGLSGYIYVFFIYDSTRIGIQLSYRASKTTILCYFVVCYVRKPNRLRSIEHFKQYMPYMYVEPYLQCTGSLFHWEADLMEALEIKTSVLIDTLKCIKIDWNFFYDQFMATRIMKFWTAPKTTPRSRLDHT